MSFYSNSKHDIEQNNQSLQADGDNLRSMYEYAPYPDLGADLKDLSFVYQCIQADIEKRDQVKFLDAGCGTGHLAVGVAKKHPEWECFGIDLSNASLDVAKQLAAMHGANVQLSQGSYLDELPYQGPFDVIAAMGTVHHCASPIKALENLKSVLKDDGYLLLHLYGYRCDKGKFDIKEMLSILEPDLSNYSERFKYYDALMKHKQGKWLKRIATTSPYDIYLKIKTGFRNFKRRMKKTSWSLPWQARYSKPDSAWIDHFCNPCERAYEVPEVKELINASGFKVLHMLKQGKEFPQLIPEEWRERYAQLGDWEKYRLSELLAEGGGSFVMVLKKA